MPRRPLPGRAIERRSRVGKQILIGGIRPGAAERDARRCRRSRWPTIRGRCRPCRSRRRRSSIRLRATRRGPLPSWLAPTARVPAAVGCRSPCPPGTSDRSSAAPCRQTPRRPPLRTSSRRSPADRLRRPGTLPTFHVAGPGRPVVSSKRAIASRNVSVRAPSTKGCFQNSSSRVAAGGDERGKLPVRHLAAIDQKGAERHRRLGAHAAERPEPNRARRDRESCRDRARCPRADRSAATRSAPGHQIGGHDARRARPASETHLAARAPSSAASRPARSPRRPAERAKVIAAPAGSETTDTGIDSSSHRSSGHRRFTGSARPYAPSSNASRYLPSRASDSIRGSDSATNTARRLAARCCSTRRPTRRPDDERRGDEDARTA